MVNYWRGQQQRIIDKIRPKVPEDRKALAELPDILNAVWWDEEIRQLLGVMGPLIAKGAAGGVVVHQAIIEPLGLAVDWTLPHTGAMEWAKKHAADLVKGISNTTKDNIRAEIVNWMDSGEHLNALTRKLADSYGFSRKRAELIAMTETTRSYARGEVIAAQEFESKGYFEYDKEWQTARDDIVRPICSDLHGKTVSGTKTPFESIIGPIQEPPAHPGCRCGMLTIPKVPE